MKTILADQSNPFSVPHQSEHTVITFGVHNCQSTTFERSIEIFNQENLEIEVQLVDIKPAGLAKGSGEPVNHT